MRFLHFAWAWVRSEWWRFRGYDIFAPVKTMEHRFGECQVCEHNREGECELCHCLIQAKIMMAPEHCPRGFWPSVKVKKNR